MIPQSPELEQEEARRQTRRVARELEMLLLASGARVMMSCHEVVGGFIRIEVSRCNQCPKMTHAEAVAFDESGEEMGGAELW